MAGLRSCRAANRAIELAPEVLDDFDRFFEHIAQFDAGSAPQRIGEILEAIQILTP